MAFFMNSGVRKERGPIQTRKPHALVCQCNSCHNNRDFSTYNSYGGRKNEKSEPFYVFSIVMYGKSFILF